jgi:hypothetical protein
MIILIIGIKNLFARITAKLHVFNESMAGNQLAIGSAPEA